MNQQQLRADNSLQLAFEELHGYRTTRRIEQNPQESPMAPQPIQNNNPPAPPPVEADNKSIAPRYSYMYRVPQLDPRKMEELKKFLIQEKKQNATVKISNWVKFKKQIGSMSLNTWYFLAMLLFELFLGLLYIVGLLVSDAVTKRVGLGVLVIVTSLVYILWIWNLSWRKDLIDRYWGWVWLGFFVDVLGGGIAGAANLWYLALIISILECLVLGLVLPGYRKTCFTGFLILGLCFVLSVGGFQVAFSIQGLENLTITLSIEYLVLFGLGLLAVAYDLFCERRWSLKTKHEKWQRLCCFYLLSIDLGFGLAIGIPGEFMWVWLTQIINGMFLICLGYFLVVVVEIKCGNHKFNIFQKLKRCWVKQQINPNLMYQMADVLLTTDRQYLKNPRKSVIGKPLAQCTICLNQQSRFCYQSCRHVCVGHDCILDWLKKGMKKCPLCREASDVMLEVKRVRDLEFEIQNRYRIGKD